jgi:hypothetical protein
MPRKPDSRGLNITMRQEDLEVVKKTAQKRGFKVTSDYLRNLIEKDKEAHNEPFKFTVNRGGYRKRSSEGEDEDEE